MAARRGIEIIGRRARSRSGGLFSQEEEKGGADRVPLMHLVVVCGVAYAVVMNCVECVCIQRLRYYSRQWTARHWTSKELGDR